MPATRLTKPAPTEPARGSWLLFFIVLMFLLCCLAIGLLIFPQLFLTVGVILAVIALQYLLWGWWMEKLYRGPNSEQYPPDDATNYPRE